MSNIKLGWHMERRKFLNSFRLLNYNSCYIIFKYNLQNNMFFSIFYLNYYFQQIASIYKKIIKNQYFHMQYLYLQTYSSLSGIWYNKLRTYAWYTAYFLYIILLLPSSSSLLLLLSYLPTSISLYSALYTNRLKYSASTYSNFYIPQIIQALKLITYKFFIAFIKYLFIHDYICMQFYFHENLPPTFYLFIIIITCLRTIVFFFAPELTICSILYKKVNYPQSSQKKKWTKPLKECNHE